MRWVRSDMETPAHLKKYPCADYFASDLPHEGLWDEASQLWLIVPVSQVEELGDAEFPQVGRPGVDGIAFGYRNGKPGLWAYHPIDSRFHLLAATLEEFLKGWYSGTI